MFPHRWAAALWPPPGYDNQHSQHVDPLDEWRAHPDHHLQAACGQVSCGWQKPPDQLRIAWLRVALFAQSFLLATEHRGLETAGCGAAAHRIREEPSIEAVSSN